MICSRNLFVLYFVFALMFIKIITPHNIVEITNTLKADPFKVVSNRLTLNK